MDQTLDRRKSPRIRDPMAIKISLDNLQEQVLEDDTYSIDISSGGLYFISNLDLRPGDRLKVKIIPLHYSIIEFGMILNASAVVLRARKLQDRTKQNLVAAKFQSVPHWQEI